jgi:LmbE family N-acetylglucosaminyl deacetylase
MSTKLSFCVRPALLTLFLLLYCGAGAQLPPAPANLPPDDRYKTDILLIVAHPDDDSLAAPYLAKAIYEEHKHVSVIYGTRGDAGGNAVGNEQAVSLGAVREIEGRRALASMGILDVWFLGAPDTPGQDVLHSLETWGHGASLEKVVRLVRLTRPEVILTWLPVYVAGENHDDHQAAGVLATEAFDIAGDPVAFPEQLAAPRDRTAIGNYGEGLHPWQAKKIYYFSDATHFEFLEGRGPRYNTSEVSPSKGVSYATIATNAWMSDKSQLPPNQTDLKKYLDQYLSEPVRFVLGKSLVKGSATGDVFEGIVPEPIPYVRAPGYEHAVREGLSLELGGPWAYYREFWRAHKLEHLSQLLSPETALGGTEKTVWVPLLIHNDTNAARQVTLRSVLPPGWTEKPGPMIYPVAPHETYPVQVNIVAVSSQESSWQQITWRAEADGQSIGSVTLRVHINYNGVPQ